jgi:glutamate/tyrosine decarboxylase-like PLP-dependent enzyme
MNENRQVLFRVFELIDRYCDLSKEASDSQVVDPLPPELLKNRLDLSISENGTTYDNLLELVESYLASCVNTTHRQFFNQLYAGMNLPAFIGEIITALTNTSMYTYEVAPAASLIEMELIDKMCSIVGFDNGEGTFLTGGSNANLMAMFSARNRAFPEVKQKGMRNIDVLTVFASDQSHYSFDTGANLLGIGSDNIRKIRSDKLGRMIPEALEEAIDKSIKAGEKPVLVAATSGTTMLGAFDPIDEIASIAEKYDIWLHVDGAFGGSVVLCDKGKKLLKGLESADSFTWDPHKLMNIPLMCSALLVKKKGTLASNLTTLDTKYIFHENDTRFYDLGKSSIQCGRRVDVLKLWLAWKYFGDKGYKRRMEKLFSLAGYATRKVESDSRLELLVPPQSIAVCFRYINENGEDTDEFNLALREGLMKSGKSLVNYGYLGKKVAIRFVAANPDVDYGDIDQFFNNLFYVAEQIDKIGIEGLRD